MSGVGVLPRGSRSPIDLGSTVRGFTYWEKVNDIDLSVFGLSPDGSQIEFSWRTMQLVQERGETLPIVYSGDETSGYNGGSEYFDVDIAAFRRTWPDVRYLVFCDNIYSVCHFNRCFCRAGYMLRKHPDSGEVRYFGKPFLGNEAEIKKRIGYSTGTVSWYPRKKLRQIVASSRRFYDTWDEAAYQQYLAMFQLDEEKTPRELSEGMKVKFNLLLALSHRAEVLILDEPTSGLDPFSRSELLEIFTHLKQEGVAVFFSTHIISDIEKCADDILYISHGELVAAASKEAFTERFSEDGESLEETMLRLERGTWHA
jgi:ABC-2 type transport system ATP-binding protein